MIGLVVVVAMAAAPGGDEAAGMSLLSRPEPHVEEGLSLLDHGEVDRAIEAFRAAAADDPDERAAVEYDVGQALLKRADDAKAAATDAPALPEEAKQAYEDARQAFARAYDVARSRDVKSEAALAAGVARARAGDVKGAIDDFRRSLIADPKNDAAKQNLLRALRFLQQQQQQQQQQQPQDGGGDEQPQGDEQQQGGEQQGDEQRQGDEEQKDGEEQKPPGGDEQKPADDKPQPGAEGEGERADDEQPPRGQDPQQPPPDPAQDGKQPAPGKPKKKGDADRVLDALRARERPLQPMLMRVPQGKLAPPEKDW